MNGSRVAYAVTDDWRFGVESYNPDTAPYYTFIHQAREDDVRPGPISLHRKRDKTRNCTRVYKVKTTELGVVLSKQFILSIDGLT